MSLLNEAIQGVDIASLILVDYEDENRCVFENFEDLRQGKESGLRLVSPCGMGIARLGRLRGSSGTGSGVKVCGWVASDEGYP